jgi:hypothetical protein
MPASVGAIQPEKETGWRERRLIAPQSKSHIARHRLTLSFPLVGEHGPKIVDCSERQLRVNNGFCNGPGFAKAFCQSLTRLEDYADAVRQQRT